MTIDERASIYCEVLEDIKTRLAVVRSVAESHLNAGSELLNYEIAALNLRKSLELIAFGTLSANKEVYAEVHADFASHWNAKKLLAKLEKLHPEFYPKPVTREIRDLGPPRQLHFEFVPNGFLTRDELVELYDMCSKVIHARNPFSESSAINFRFSVLEWESRIERLLGLHLVRLAGTPQLWLAELSAPTDGRAHTYIAGPVSP
jgi:hypothetical protein